VGNKKVGKVLSSDFGALAEPAIFTVLAQTISFPPKPVKLQFRRLNSAEFRRTFAEQDRVVPMATQGPG
jgi:hypothetical protein